MAFDRRRPGTRLWTDLGPFRLVREDRQRVLGLPAEAERLQRYVANGGTLVFTPRFACQPEAEPKGPSLALRAGVGKDAVPGCGLADAWNFQLTERTEIVPQYHSGEMRTFPLDGLSQSLRGVKAAGLTVFREQVRHEGWTTLAEYADRTPAIMTRTVGKGRLVYWNAVYQSHHYIQWVTHASKKPGFSEEAGLLDQRGHLKPLPFVFRPGKGQLLAFTAAPVTEVKGTPATPRLTAGQPLDLTVQILDATGRPVAGAFPLELRATCASQEISGLQRSFSAPSGQRVRLQTALTDSSGSWTIRVRED